MRRDEEATMYGASSWSKTKVVHIVLDDRDARLAMTDEEQGRIPLRGFCGAKIVGGIYPQVGADQLVCGECLEKQPDLA